MSTKQRIWGALLMAPIVVAAMGLVGCSSYDEEMKQARDAFYEADYALAEEELDKLLEDRGEVPATEKSEAEHAPMDSDAVLFMCEKAMVKLAQGDATGAHALLKNAADRFDYLEQKLVVEEIASWVADDTSKAYQGEPYEIVLVRTLLTLTALVTDNPGAVAWSNEAISVQERVLARRSAVVDELQKDRTEEERAQAKKALMDTQIPLAPFVAGTMAEDYKKAAAEAVRNYERAASYSDSGVSKSLMAYSNRASTGQYTRVRGHGVVWVYGLVGRGPIKVTVAMPDAHNWINAAKIAWAASGKGGFFVPTGRIPVPELQRMDNAADGFIIESGQAAQSADELGDLDVMARTSFDACKSQIYAKAFIRRMIKVVAEQAAKELNKDAWVDLGITIISAIAQASEVADTRCWSFLPRWFRVTRLELPPGEHDLTIQPTLQGQPNGGRATFRVRVDPGKPTYVLTYTPWQGTPTSVMSNKLAPIPTQ